MFAARSLILFAVVATAATGLRAPADDPFDPAREIPADVRLYVHVESPRHAFDTIEQRPIAALFHRVLGGDEFGLALERLAKQAGLDQDELIDDWLGERMTLVLRDEGDRTDWLLRTVVDPKRHAKSARALKPVHRAPLHDFRIAELPEHELMWTRSEGTLIVGPTQPGRLFREHVARWADEAAPMVPLATHPAITTLTTDEGQSAALFVRHPQPLGGWSVVRAQVAGDHVRIRQASRFEVAPFERPLTRMTWDIGPAEALADGGLGVVIEPTDIGFGPLDDFLSALGVPLTSSAMRANLGDCRMYTIGEVDGRLEPGGLDPLLPTGAMAMQIRNPRTALSELDDHMIRCTSAMNDLVPDKELVPAPKLRTKNGVTSRWVHLDRLLDELGARHPAVRAPDLGWTVANGERGSYYVIATHPDELDRAVAAIETPASSPPHMGQWTNAGCLDGVRIARHLRDNAEHLAAMAALDDPSRESLEYTLGACADLARGVDWCRWRLCRPAQTEMRLEIELRLSDPETAKDGGGRRR